MSERKGNKTRKGRATGTTPNIKPNIKRGESAADSGGLETLASALTPAQVRAMCEDFAYRHGGDETDAADVLALLTAATFKPDAGDREGLLLAARAAFMPWIERASTAVDTLVRERLEAWRG